MNQVGRPGVVSVIVASFNHARFLPQRMESLLSQTYEHLEILVIDDQSSDNSLDVLRQYGSDPKVRMIVREENGGWVTVSNQGVELSSGEYVIFANCDDDCDQLMIESLVKALAENPSAGMAFCRSLLVDESDHVLGDDFRVRETAFQRRCASDTLLSGSEFSRFLLESCVVPNLSAALFRRECLVTVGDLSASYRVVCDWDLFFRVAEQYDVCYLSDPLNRFRQHPRTIRGRTEDRVVYAEYLRLLLPRLRALNLGWRERWRARRQAMSIWTLYLVAPSLSGLRDFPYHLAVVLRYDAPSLLMLVPAVVRRGTQVFPKLFAGRKSSQSAAIAS